MSTLEAWGLTNDPIWIERTKAYRDAALQDGWVATDDTDEHFKKEGFKLHVLSRIETGGKYKYAATIDIWGPDGLVIIPPNEYNWESIKSRVRRCNYCDKEDVETHRVSFAGRCCSECLPEKQKKLEYLGWCD